MLVVKTYSRDERDVVFVLNHAFYADGRLYRTERPGEMGQFLSRYRIRQSRLTHEVREALARKILEAAKSGLETTYDVSNIWLGKYRVRQCFGCPDFDLDVVLWIDGCRQIVSIKGIDICTLQILSDNPEPWCTSLAKRDRDESPLEQRQKRMAGLPVSFQELLLAVFSLQRRGGSIWCKGKACIKPDLRLPYQEEWSGLPSQTSRSKRMPVVPTGASPQP